MIDEFHEHKFFIWKTFESYEPKVLGNLKGELIYEKKEYAILGCNCSEVRKVRVKEQ